MGLERLHRYRSICLHCIARCLRRSWRRSDADEFFGRNAGDDLSDGNLGIDDDGLDESYDFRYDLDYNVFLEYAIDLRLDVEKHLGIDFDFELGFDFGFSIGLDFGINPMD